MEIWAVAQAIAASPGAVAAAGASRLRVLELLARIAVVIRPVQCAAAGALSSPHALVAAARKMRRLALSHPLRAPLCVPAPARPHNRPGSSAAGQDPTEALAALADAEVDKVQTALRAAQRSMAANQHLQASRPPTPATATSAPSSSSSSSSSLLPSGEPAHGGAEAESPPISALRGRVKLLTDAMFPLARLAEAASGCAASVFSALGSVRITAHTTRPAAMPPVAGRSRAGSGRNDGEGAPRLETTPLAVPASEVAEGGRMRGATALGQARWQSWVTAAEAAGAEGCAAPTQPAPPRPLARCEAAAEASARESQHPPRTAAQEERRSPAAAAPAASASAPEPAPAPGSGAPRVAAGPVPGPAEAAASGAASASAAAASPDDAAAGSAGEREASAPAASAIPSAPLDSHSAGSGGGSLQTPGGASDADDLIAMSQLQRALLPFLGSGALDEDDAADSESDSDAWQPAGAAGTREHRSDSDADAAGAPIPPGQASGPAATVSSDAPSRAPQAAEAAASPANPPTSSLVSRSMAAIARSLKRRRAEDEAGGEQAAGDDSGTAEASTGHKASKPAAAVADDPRGDGTGGRSPSPLIDLPWSMLHAAKRGRPASD